MSYLDIHRIEYRACPICDSTDFETLRDQDWSWRPDYQRSLLPVIRWMACRSCGHQFTWGYHTKAGLDIILGHTQGGQTAQGMTAAQIEAARLTWVSLVDAVSVRCSQGRWLDVGAGAGMLAALARECGFEVLALEARQQVAEALRSRGIDVLAGDVTELGDGPSGDFDVISLCDVLEHVAFPISLLRAVTHALRSGGVLTISCPNRDSLVWDAWNEEGINPYWSEIEHYHNFSFRHLREVLALHGYDRVTCSVSPRYRACMQVIASKGSRL